MRSRGFYVAGALALALVSGCFSSQSVMCGDTVCPAGKVCSGVNSSPCVDQEQKDACDGKLDGTDCALTAGHGKCDLGLCILQGCGDGVVEADEACDDGNTLSGDGCRSDCKKIEVCGDGVVDANEPCDDGNTNPNDGCDACRSTEWRVSAVVVGQTPASTVDLFIPTGVAVDQHGNFFIADSNANRVRRVDAVTGAIITIAGTGTGGYSGDGGPATRADLNQPSAIALDGLDNIFVADKFNHCIRRIDGDTGVITTVAGRCKTSGFSGDAGPAVLANLNIPSGIAVDGLGKLVIADTNNHRIRAVDPLSGVITTIAGTGTAGTAGDGGAATSAQLNTPNGVLIDAAGNVVVADTNNHAIRRVIIGGTITTIAGTLGAAGSGGDGASATLAHLSSPFGIVRTGNALLIADTNNHVVRQVDAGGTINRIAGVTGSAGFVDGVTATSGKLDHPFGLAVDLLGTIYIADGFNGRVRKVDAANIISTSAGTGSSGFTGDLGPGTSAILALPSHVVFDNLGRLLVVERNHHRIRRLDTSTGVITTVAGLGTAGFAGDGMPATAALLDSPDGVVCDAAGNLFIADTNNNRVRRVDATTGVIATVAGTGSSGFSGDTGLATNAQLGGPKGVAIDASGNLYVADTANHRIRRVSAGVITTVAGTVTGGALGDGGPATSAQLNFPSDVIIDGAGNVIVADTNNHAIRRVIVGGAITTIAGTLGMSGATGDAGPATSARLNGPFAIARDGNDLFIADRFNHRIRSCSGCLAGIGTINTTAGTGAPPSPPPDLTGDGGQAATAKLNGPCGVAVDVTHNIYISDTSNATVRRVLASNGRIVAVAGQVDPDGMWFPPRARLADPRAIAMTPRFTLFAGGTSGTIQALRNGRLEVVAGRYPQSTPTMSLARYRDTSFSRVTGLAYETSNSHIYFTESNTNQVQVVTVVDPDDPTTWTIAVLANTAGTAGFSDSTAASSLFREPTGLYLDESTHQLYIADTGNHVVRKLDLSTGTVTTVAGRAQTLGFFGDNGLATDALLYQPEGVTRCSNGDLFIADTGNHRVRRIEATTGKITTVVGDGSSTSSGDGAPAKSRPVDAPRSLACDGLGDLFVTSTSTIRLLPSSSGIVDGTGTVETIYGLPPRTEFPMSVTRCLAGLAISGEGKIEIADSCTGLLIELQRTVH